LDIKLKGKKKKREWVALLCLSSLAFSMLVQVKEKGDPAGLAK
jgi:hypothetical protein